MELVQVQNALKAVSANSRTLTITLYLTGWCVTRLCASCTHACTRTRKVGTNATMPSLSQNVRTVWRSKPEALKPEDNPKPGSTAEEFARRA